MDLGFSETSFQVEVWSVSIWEGCLFITDWSRWTITSMNLSPYLNQNGGNSMSKYYMSDWRWLSSGMLIIALMMEAVSTSETSGIFYQTTRHNIPEDSHLHTCCCENLKSYKTSFIFFKTLDW
jgi:hypothetical protein